jgi:hypothetical protein
MAAAMKQTENKNGLKPLLPAFPDLFPFAQLAAVRG